jgi:hypothetical protein
MKWRRRRTGGAAIATGQSLRRAVTTGDYWQLAEIIRTDCTCTRCAPAALPDPLAVDPEVPAVAPLPELAPLPLALESRRPVTST